MWLKLLMVDHTLYQVTFNNGKQSEYSKIQ